MDKAQSFAMQYGYYDKGKKNACCVGYNAGYKQAEKDLALTWDKCTEQMPSEKKYESDNLQGHHEWMESELVLAWDSMYGPRVDSTRNGKWRSEQMGGYIGQVAHGIVAWMPIPKYIEEEL